MFQSSKARLRALLDRFDDILGDPVDTAPPHPHRTPLRWERERRPGAVPARPAHCISPVRSDPQRVGRTRAPR
jgi:hypothetical protein